MGERIRQLRTERGWTLERLSEASGVEVGTLSALEVRNSSRSKYAPQIALAFGISVDQLFGVVAINQGTAEPDPRPYLAALIEAFDDLLPEEQQAVLSDITMRARDNRQKWEAMQRKFGLPEVKKDADVGKYIKPRPAQREFPLEPPEPRARKKAKK